MRSKMSAAAFFLCLNAISVLVGCTRSYTREELVQLREMERRFPEYRFRFTDGTYLDATNKAKDNVPQEEGMALYKAFWLGENGTRRPGIELTYLDVFNQRGEFLYQVNYASDGKFYFGSSPYH
jgi:hypothetical protein